MILPEVGQEALHRGRLARAAVTIEENVVDLLALQQGAGVVLHLPWIKKIVIASIHSGILGLPLLRMIAMRTFMKLLLV